MKNLMFLTLVALILSLSSCNSDEQLLPQERIVGTWIGAEFPNQDQIVFYDDNTAVITGRGGSNQIKTYIIDDVEIRFSAPSSSSASIHSYSFMEGDRIYIQGIMPSVGIEDDGGIEYQKK